MASHHASAGPAVAASTNVMRGYHPQSVAGSFAGSPYQSSASASAAAAYHQYTATINPPYPSPLQHTNNIHHHQQHQAHQTPKPFSHQLSSSNSSPAAAGGHHSPNLLSSSSSSSNSLLLHQQHTQPQPQPQHFWPTASSAAPYHHSPPSLSLSVSDGSGFAVGVVGDYGSQQQHQLLSSSGHPYTQAASVAISHHFEQQSPDYSTPNGPPQPQPQPQSQPHAGSVSPNGDLYVKQCFMPTAARLVNGSPPQPQPVQRISNAKGRNSASDAPKRKGHGHKNASPIRETTQVSLRHCCKR